MHDRSVFVSYARQDAEAAQRIYRALQNAGCHPWLDTYDLRPGERWGISIQEAIKRCRYFLALLSSRSVARKGYVHTELSRAMDELDAYPESQIYLIPARLDDCPMPRQRLRELHWVDLFPDWHAGINKILRTIRAIDLSNGKHNLPPPLIHLQDLMNELDQPPFGKEGLALAGMGTPLPCNLEIAHCCSLTPTADDPNAARWVADKNSVIHDSVEGFWSSRWRAYNDNNWHVGIALLRREDDWIIIEVQDNNNKYLVRVRESRPRCLIGGYLNCDSYYDIGAWAGLIVDHTRIDGFWDFGEARWDLRR
jgi:hypothetical protein